MDGVVGKKGIEVFMTARILPGANYRCSSGANEQDSQLITRDSLGRIFNVKYDGKVIGSSDGGVTWYTVCNNGGWGVGFYGIAITRDLRLIIVNWLNGELYSAQLTSQNTLVNPTLKLTFDVADRVIGVFVDYNNNIYGCCHINNKLVKVTTAQDNDPWSYIVVHDFGVSVRPWTGFCDVDNVLYFISAKTLGDDTTRNSIYKSTDGGLTFEECYVFELSYGEVVNGIDGDDIGNIYVTTFTSVSGNYCHLFLSTNKASTFLFKSRFDTPTRFFGCVTITKNEVLSVTNPSATSRLYKNIVDDRQYIEQGDKTLDNAENMMFMTKGSDVIRPTDGLHIERFIETQTPISVLRKEITNELEKDGFTDITVSEEANTGAIIFNCKHE
jgi:hypothetical protein